MVSRLTLRKRSFNELVMDAIDQVLSSFGENSKIAVYDRLEKDFNIKKQEIPYRINDFSKALESLFGLSAMHLENMFMKNLYAKIRGFECFSCEMAVSKVTFSDYVCFMRKMFEEAKLPGRKIGILTS
jgi:hypothetical protein